ncbi:hypothetical protein C8R44DRAFT_890830 [Mycena epipterygia]|nr:hypothetical protein C8R44DRAFT_890830 [Mycena epipterygia]
MPPKANKSSTKGKGKVKLPKARFMAKAKTGSKRGSSPSESDLASPSSSHKRQHTGSVMRPASSVCGSVSVREIEPERHNRRWVADKEQPAALAAVLLILVVSLWMTHLKSQGGS